MYYNISRHYILIEQSVIMIRANLAFLPVEIKILNCIQFLIVCKVRSLMYVSCSCFMRKINLQDHRGKDNDSISLVLG